MLCGIDIECFLGLDMLNNDGSMSGSLSHARYYILVIHLEAAFTEECTTLM